MRVFFDIAKLNPSGHKAMTRPNARSQRNITSARARLVFINDPVCCRMGNLIRRNRSTFIKKMDQIPTMDDITAPPPNIIAGIELIDSSWRKLMRSRSKDSMSIRAETDCWIPPGKIESPKNKSPSASDNLKMLFDLFDRFREFLFMSLITETIVMFDATIST